MKQLPSFLEYLRSPDQEKVCQLQQFQAQIGQIAQREFEWSRACWNRLVNPQKSNYRAVLGTSIFDIERRRSLRAKQNTSLLEKDLVQDLK